MFAAISIFLTNIFFVKYFITILPINVLIYIKEIIMNDKCPIKYTTYKQSPAGDERGDVIETYPILPTELRIEEYNGNGEQTTHFARLVRRSVTHRDSDDEDEDLQSDSSETGEADDSQSTLSSDSEHGSDN